MRSLADRLIALNHLRQSGFLSEEEFTVAKARVIAEYPEGDPGPSGPAPPGPSPRTLDPVVPAVGLGLGAAAGGFGG